MAKPTKLRFFLLMAGLLIVGRTAEISFEPIDPDPDL